jgi:hypothetical protein
MRVLPLAVVCLLTLGSGMAAGGLPPTTACSCATAPYSDGWCEAHGVGWVAAIEIRSRLLYDALDAHGHVLDLSTFHCATCKSAIETDGFCDEHKNGFVKGLVYFSRLTYELARGAPLDPATLECPVCRAATRAHGWCETHGRGFVGHVAIGDRTAWQRAVDAAEIVRSAVAAISRCEFCALAMVTDTRCPRCKITYRHGAPLP